MNRKLKNFCVDPKRHSLYVDVEFYQMNLSNIVAKAQRDEPACFDGDTLPSWSKFAAHPFKAKGFFTYMLQAMFQGKHGADELNVDLQIERGAGEDIRVAMMFLSGSIRNENLRVAANIAQEALPAYDVIAVYGEEMTNATAEPLVRDAIERAVKAKRNVLLLSAGMAQRSFSIPEITELYLAYDAGDNGATIQKMSRALTPHKAGKIGRIVSLSFDPNRDDKFDAMLIETAQNYKKNKGIADIKDALRAVLKTVDIFACQADGSIKIEADEYLEQALARDSVDRVIGKIAPFDKLTPGQIKALANGKADVFRAETVMAAERGRTAITEPKAKGAKVDKPATETDIARAREVIVTIAQNFDIIRLQGGANLDESFEIIDKSPKIVRLGITEDFGVDYALIKDLLLNGIINRELLELKFS